MKAALFTLTLLAIPNFAFAGKYATVSCKAMTMSGYVQIVGTYDDQNLRATDWFVVSRTDSNPNLNKTFHILPEAVSITKAGSWISFSSRSGSDLPGSFTASGNLPSSTSGVMYGRSLDGIINFSTYSGTCYFN